MRSGNSYFLPSPSLAPPTNTAASQPRTKYILVTGGVCSSLGKGVTTSTVGALLKSQGYRVSSIKIDPYINVDAGLMSPFEHGEVYVLGDGGEVDLDLGNYERWMGISLTRDHNITTGKVYQTLINREREGKYLGKTVTLVPHFTNEVVEHINRVAAIPVDGSGLRPHICMIELGGTIGDFESAPFVEALRTLRFTCPPEDFALIHCTYLPVMGGSQKTKPTQHSCRNLLSLGLSADFLVCRSEFPVEPTTRDKLSQLCGIKSKYILDAHNVSCLYDIPGSFSEQQIVQKLVHKLRLGALGEVMAPLNFPEPQQWAVFAKSLTNPSKTVKIAFVGKYLQQGSDAYFSVMQTFEHCCLTLNVGLEFLWIDSELLEGADEAATTEAIKGCDGIFVPGGFGKRGTNGKIKAAQIARENNIPYFGVCLGMQIALIEIARNVLGLKDANSEEMDDKTPNRIVMFMPEVDRATMGANMRLGARVCHITDKDGTSIMKKIYAGADAVRERHRHRYEFNMQFFEKFQTAGGVRFTGSSDPNYDINDTRIEAFELPNHPFFLAVQYHPEFVTTPFDPSPPYLAFVAAAGKVDYAWPTSGGSRTVKA